MAAMTFANAAEDTDVPLYLTLEPPPSTVQTPQEEQASFRIADGFRIELVAAEPLIEDPVSIEWDEDGNLYAVEMRGFMPDSYGTGQEAPIGSVVRLLDDNEDGVMDRRELLLDDLVLPRAIAIVPQGLLIAEPPTLWLCPGELNQASTIDCAKKYSLGEYGNAPGSVEHQENALLLALDNWIYSAKSARKIKIVNDALEIRATVFRGQWGLSQDDDGLLYYNTNSNLLSGDLFADNDAVRTGILPAPGLVQRLHTDDEVFSIRVNPGVNRAYLENVLRSDGRLRAPTSASGVEIYRGNQFPESFYGMAFVPESAGNLVAQLHIEKEDLDYQTTHITYPDAQWEKRDFLASTDERFRPTEVKTGPDGALYVVDMYRGIIQDYVFMSDQLREQVVRRNLDRPLGLGRIWRIVHDDSEISYLAPKLSSATNSELLNHLSHTNAWWRSTAQRMLAATESIELQGALTLKLSATNPATVIHALWTLEARAELTRENVLAIIERQNVRLFNHALRAGCQLLTTDDVLNLLEENSSAAISNQQNLLFCAGTHYSESVFGLLTERVEIYIENPYLRTALQTAIAGREVALIEQLIAEQLIAEKPIAEKPIAEKPIAEKPIAEKPIAANPESNNQLGEFVQALARQAVLGAKTKAVNPQQLLDVVQRLNQSQMRGKILSGIYAATHANGFERIVLFEPHPLFADTNDPVLTDARRAFTWAGDIVTDKQKPLDAASQIRMDQGEGLFASHCAVCHGVNGEGTTALAPQLSQSRRITQAPEQLMRIIMHGISGPLQVAGVEWNSVMPGMSHLAEFDDEGISGLITFLRRSWGHNGGPIQPDAIADVRHQVASREVPWTSVELEAVPINLRYQAFVGKYGGFEFSYNGQGLEVFTSTFSGPLIEIKEDVFLFEERAIQIEFDRVEQGYASAVWYQGDSGKTKIARTLTP